MVNGLVSPLAAILLVGTYENSTIPDSTWSLTKCHWMSICFVLEWNLGSLARAIAPWLSALIMTRLVGRP